MPRSEDIRNTIWSDLDEVLESNDAMLLYIWSWTNERCGASGVYTCPRRFLLEGRLDRDALEAALGQCETAGKIRYVEGVLWSVTRVKRLGWKNPNAAKAIAKEIAEFDASNPIVAEFVDRYRDHPWGKDGDRRLDPTLPDGLAKGSGTDGDGSDNPSGTHAKPLYRANDADGSGTHAHGSKEKAKATATAVVKGSGSGEVVVEGSQATVDLRETAGPELAEVAQILGRISEVRRLPFADHHRVAAAIATYPDADAIAVARDWEDWLCNGRGRTADVPDLIQGFRSQLDRKRGRRGAGGRSAAEHPADRRVREIRERGEAPTTRAAA